MPDLIVVDGGRGQLQAALTALDRLGLELPAIGLAKREEEIWLPDHPDPIRLARKDPALKLLQRLRDEAHRFANTYHQKLRERRIVFSALDEISGVGEQRKRALIRHFGSVRNIRAAGVDQIAAVEGIGAKVAERIHRYLQEHPA